MNYEYNTWRLWQKVGLTVWAETVVKVRKVLDQSFGFWCRQLTWNRCQMCWSRVIILILFLFWTVNAGLCSFFTYLNYRLPYRGSASAYLPLWNKKLPRLKRLRRRFHQQHHPQSWYKSHHTFRFWFLTFLVSLSFIQSDYETKSAGKYDSHGVVYYCVTISTFLVFFQFRAVSQLKYGNDLASKMSQKLS